MKNNEQKTNVINHVSLLHIQDKKVLLCVSKGKTKWQLPGGKVNPGETDEEALIRECKEELSVDVVPETIKLYDTVEGQAHSKENGIIVKVKIFSALFKGKIVPSNEIEDAKYLTYSEIPDTSDLGWTYFSKLKKENLLI